MISFECRSWSTRQNRTSTTTTTTEPGAAAEGNNQTLIIPWAQEHCVWARFDFWIGREIRHGKGAKFVTILRSTNYQPPDGMFFPKWWEKRTSSRVHPIQVSVTNRIGTGSASCACVFPFRRDNENIEWVYTLMPDCRKGLFRVIRFFYHLNCCRNGTVWFQVHLKWKCHAFRFVDNKCELEYMGNHADCRGGRRRPQTHLSYLDRLISISSVPHYRARWSTHRRWESNKFQFCSLEQSIFLSRGWKCKQSNKSAF